MRNPDTYRGSRRDWLRNGRGGKLTTFHEQWAAINTPVQKLRGGLGLNVYIGRPPAKDRPHAARGKLYSYVGRR